MLLDGIYVFFEVCIGLAAVIAALWLATKVLGYVYMLFAGELSGSSAERPRREPEGRRHQPTAG